MGSRPECGPYGLARGWRSSDEGHKQQSQQQGSTQTALEDLENHQRLQPRPLPMKMAAPSQTASELPLEELLALYGYEVPGQLLQPGRDRCHLAAGLPHITLDKDQVTKDMFAGDEEEDPSADDDLAPSYTSNTSDLLRRLRGGDKHTDAGSSEEDSDGGASVPSNEERKDIMVGSMYQAQIPPLSPYSSQGRAYDGDDQLLWTPGVLPPQEVEDFLCSAQTPGGQEMAPYTNAHGDTVRDNEQALYELVKCNFNAEEALRRLHFNVKVFNDELCSWSEEECRGFQQGYRAYGKNFNLIQANKVRTRSVGECVQYYYLWKKSERHECFTQQAPKMGRRKFTLQSANMDDADQYEDLGPLESHGNTKASSHKPLRAQRMSLAPSTAQCPDKPGSVNSTFTAHAGVTAGSAKDKPLDAKLCLGTLNAVLQQFKNHLEK